MPNLVNILWTNYFSESKTYLGSITRLLFNMFQISEGGIIWVSSAHFVGEQISRC